MLGHNEIECFEKHELKVSSKNISASLGDGNVTSRRNDTKFYPSDKYILLTCGEILGIKYLKESDGFVEDTMQFKKNHVNPIVSVSICQESGLICTCSDEAVILWKLDSQLKTWSSTTIGVDMGRIQSSAISLHGANIFTSLARGSDLIVFQCIQNTDTIQNANESFALSDLELLATSEKNIDLNTWLHNFHFEDKLHIAGLASGNRVSLQIWEVSKNNVKLKCRSALQMKILAAADFTKRDEEFYILAISPEGHCETFVGTLKGLYLLSRIRIEENTIDATTIPNNDVQVEFRISSARFFTLKMRFSHYDDNSLNKTNNYRTFNDESKSANTSLDLDNSLVVSDKKNLRCSKLLICVATTRTISIINLINGEIILNLKYEGLLKKENVIISNAKLVSHDGEIIFAYQPLLQNYVFTLRIRFYEMDDQDLLTGIEKLSLISSESLRSKSVLCKKLKSPRQQSGAASRRMTLGFPIIRNRSTLPKRSSFSKMQGLSLFKSQKSTRVKGAYDPSSGDIPSLSANLWSKGDYSIENLKFREQYGKKHQTPLSSGLTYLRITFSSDGKFLAAGANVSPLAIFRTRPTFETVAIHRAIGRLTALDFSFNSKYLAVATNDGHTSVINWKSGKELLGIKFSSKFNEHTHSQFYFMDKFILQPEDNRLVLYSYRVQESACLKLIAGSFPLACQQITAVVAANQLYSNLIFCGLSNKSVQIFDANVEKVVATFSQTHSKSVTCIRINEAPKGYNATNLCDFFLTSSPSAFDPIKLWDLRSAKCVSRIGDVNINVHVPNSRPAFSPCGRYIACGFEDNTVVLYDVRQINSRVTCLKGIGSTVLDCTFDRREPIIWCGSRSGEFWNFFSQV